MGTPCRFKVKFNIYSAEKQLLNGIKNRFRFLQAQYFVLGLTTCHLVCLSGDILERCDWSSH
jgi:hypothetical protein